MNNPIGILDSGIGGLSVWKEIKKLLPHESLIYIADTKNCPYGDKTDQEIYILARALVVRLLSYNVKLIVIACNTITVTCIERLRQEFPDTIFVGVVPVIKTAVSVTQNKKIGILSTNRTNESNYQKYLIQEYAKDCMVTCVGTNTIVPLIELGVFEGETMDILLRKELKPFLDAGIDVLALGCTHFPFIKNSIQKVLGNIQILDSGAAVARQVKKILSSQELASSQRTPQYIFDTSGDSYRFETAINHILKDVLTGTERFGSEA